MTQYNLAHLGVQHLLEIEGVLTEVDIAAGGPIVFLIDESHGHAASIAQNVANVEHLIEHANVRLIGVESHHPADVGIGEQAGDVVDPTFANDLSGNPDADIAGVESLELFGLMDNDTGAMPPAEIAAYPVNYLRSYFFLTALFRHRRHRAVNGNIVLNAGRNHINHIRQLIGWGGAHQLAGTAARYVHIRPTAFP